MNKITEPLYFLSLIVAILGGQYYFAQSLQENNRDTETRLTALISENTRRIENLDAKFDRKFDNLSTETTRKFEALSAAIAGIKERLVLVETRLARVENKLGTAELNITAPESKKTNLIVDTRHWFSDPTRL